MSEEEMVELLQEAVKAHGFDDTIVAAGQFNCWSHGERAAGQRRSSAPSPGHSSSSACGGSSNGPADCAEPDG
jgi:hypothetical protein